jgi:hypothetical protein
MYTDIMVECGGGGWGGVRIRTLYIYISKNLSLLWIRIGKADPI